MALGHWLQLAMTDGIGPILANRLIEATGSVEAAVDALPKRLSQIEGIGTKKADAIHRGLREAVAAADEEMAKAAATGVSIFCIEDEAYPLLLRSIPDPPLVLYVRGILEPRDLNGFAIVGSRKCSYYGREQAERFGALLAGAGFTVLSGGARGTDSAAHRGALSHPQGRTIAVLGSGVDVAYPPENAGLFVEIAKRGAVVSEFALGTPPMAENFPRRNRIISGMSRGVLVTEAAERSGALITARQAGEDQGRPVFALPGRVDNPLATGPLQLLRDGAFMAAHLDDILPNLGPLPEEAHAEGLFDSVADAAPPNGVNEAAPRLAVPSHLSDRQQLILERMANDSLTVDQLIEVTGLEAGVILQEMTLLSLMAVVKRVDGQTFARKR